MVKILLVASASLTYFSSIAQQTDSLPGKLPIVPADSIIQQYFKQVKSQFKDKYNTYKIDSLHRNNTAALRDSLRSEWKNNKITGSTTLAHDYGLLPALIDSSETGPISMYSTRGDFVLQTMKLPVKLSYNYSTFQVPYGLNNYFRVGIDFNRLQQMKQERMEQVQGQFDKESLENKVQLDSLNGKMDYALILKDYTKHRLELEKEKLLDLESRQAQLSDSLKGTSQADSLALQRQQTIEKIAYYEKLGDSLQQIYNQFQEVKEMYESNQYDLEKQKEQVLGKGTALAKSQFESVTGKLLGGFKKVNVGLSYPQSTGLSGSTIPIKGIDLEHQYGNWYTAFSAGLTVNTLQFTNNQFQNNLNNAQNALNFFDFQVLKNNQFITLVKTGYGSKENSHAFLGFRYLAPNTFLTKGAKDTSSASLGIELDIRIKTKYLKNTLVDLIYGKTNQSAGNAAGEQDNFFTAQTNTALLRINQQFPKLKTELTASYRRIDPFVDTRNMGLMQADNERVEWQTKHRIGSRLSMVFTYRNDHNNLARQKDSTLSISLYGAQVQTAIGRILQIVGSINYLELGQKSLDGKRGATQHNYLGTLFLSSNYQLKKMTGNISATYSDNLIDNQNGTKLFTNIGAQHSFMFSKFSNTTAYNYYKTNASDSLTAQNKIGIWSNTTKIKLNKLQLGASLRYAPNASLADGQESKSNFGFGLDLQYTINKYLTLQTKIEKPILGDYFNTFYQDRYLNFPYTINSKIIVNIN